MNAITLVGRVAATPVYHCTERAMDLTRIQLTTTDRRGGSHCHHCLAFGPAALALHEHLETGNQLLVRGELLYRPHQLNGRIIDRPYILIRGYSFLDATARKAPPSGVRPTGAATASG